MRAKECFVLLVLFICGCMRAPTPPSWDTTLNLPLASRKILIKDIAPDTLLPDSIAIFKEGVDVDTIRAELCLDSITKDTSLTLKDIAVNKSFRDTIIYTVASLMPALIPFHGDTMDLPAGSATKEDTFVFRQDYLDAHVDSGYFRLSVYNALFLRIDSLRYIFTTPDTLIFWFFDISPGESQSEQQDVNGYDFRNLIPFQATIWTHDTTGVVIDTGAYMQGDCELFIKKVSSVIGKFPACTTEINVDMKLKPYKIDIAVIDTGEINISVWNPARCEFDMELSGNECSFLPVNSPVFEGSNDTTVRLENDTIKPVNPDTLKLSALLSTGGGSVFDTVNDADTFLLSVKLRDLSLFRFKGFIDTIITIDIPSYGKRIDYYGLDPTPIVLDSVWLYYDLWNGMNATPNLNLILGGEREGNWRYLNLKAQLGFGENYNEIGGDTVINFVNSWPESIDVSGNVSLTGAIDVRSEDKMWGEIGFMVPLDFTVDDTLIFEPETLVSINVPSDVKETTILSTRLLVWMLNTTSVTGDASLYLSNDSTAMGEPIVVLTLCSGECKEWRNISVDELLKSEKLWAKVRARLFPGHFRIFVRDRIHIKTLLEVKARIGG